jgi:septal ring factor EnvC (AmiA/AmiB activator)
MIRCRLLVLLVFFSCIGGAVSAQSVKELQKKKSGILNELSVTQDLIKKSEKDKEVSLSKLLLLRSQVNSRKRLIDNLSQEIAALNVEIVEGELRLSTLGLELNDLKIAYASLVTAAYKTRYNQQRMIFIFSAKDFNQAYLRMRYFREFSSLIKRKGDDIVATSQEVTKELNAVKLKRQSLSSAIEARNKEVTSLSIAEKSVNVMVQQLQKRSSELRDEQKRLTQESMRIEKEIANLLAEERRKASSNGKIIYSPVDMKVSSKFEDNRGKFPAPLENGVVIEGFGEHNHPVLAHVKVKSNGVKIVSSSGSTVYSIFNGQVSRVISIPGLNKIVIIRHGKFLSVYSNLTQVFVKVGDNIAIGQSLGMVKQGSFLQFEIWKEDQPLDPEVWLRK